MEGNVTTMVYHSLNWIVTNSPNTTISFLAIFGVILAVSIAFETANKFVSALAYFFAICIYFPYCYIKKKLGGVQNGKE